MLSRATCRRNYWTTIIKCCFHIALSMWDILQTPRGALPFINLVPSIPLTADQSPLYPNKVHDTAFQYRHLEIERLQLKNRAVGGMAILALRPCTGPGILISSK